MSTYKKIQQIGLLLTLFFSVSLVMNANNSAIIDSANAAYNNGDYELASNYYKRIIDSGFVAPEVYYNLANSYYKSNKVIMAILFYEKALKLAPHDEEIAFNLEIARKHVVDKIEVLPRLFIWDWFDKLVNLFSTDKWAYISIISFILTLLAFLFFFFTKIIAVKKAGFWLGLLLLFISIISFNFSYKQKNMIVNHNTAIIFSSTVTVKSSPDESGTDLFVLHEGTKVMLEDSVQNWVEIKIANGHKGWLKATDIVKI
ncbi:MAG: tetratricopeptide repeat protein [Chlorobi bacterium]|nr:tetratricopeptide repeat protein [Chlorobiota bacterium]